MTEVQNAIIDAPAEKVWAAITEAEHIKKWFPEADHEIGELKPGGLMTFHFSDGGDVHAEIVEAEPNKVFSYRIVSKVSDEDLTDTNSITVHFTLTPYGDKTRLRLEESNSHQDKIKAVAESLQHGLRA